MNDMKNRLKNYVLSFLKSESGVSPKEIKETKSIKLTAAYDKETDTIFIKHLSKVPTIDEVFFVSHEWRHCWQFKKDPSFLKDYKERDQFDNINDYNNQPAEVDANAWAWHILSLLTEDKGRPTFPGLSRETVDKIERRKLEIEREEK